MLLGNRLSNEYAGSIITEELLYDEIALPVSTKRPWFSKVFDGILTRRKRPAGYEAVSSGSKSPSLCGSPKGKPWTSCRKQAFVGVLLSLFAMGIWMSIIGYSTFFGYGQQRASTAKQPPTQWERPSWLEQDIALRSESISRNPIPCHSHNDFTEQDNPLLDALRAGCTGVEADVWPADGTLWLGHEFPKAPWRWTFRQVYVSPLMELLDFHNPSNSTEPTGIFLNQPTQSLVLLIDFKGNGTETLPYMQEELAPLREKNYLTYYDGTSLVQRPITVVTSGNAPFNQLAINDTHRDVFFDAPLARLMDKGTSGSWPLEAGQGLTGVSGGANGIAELFDWTNSYYASVSLKKQVGLLPFVNPSKKKLAKVRSQIEEAHRKGLKVRYWGTPKRLHWRRKKIWKLLWKEGVDYLNVDHLQEAVQFFESEAQNR